MDKIISGVCFFSIRSTIKYLEEGNIYEYTTKKGFKKFLIRR